MAATASGWQVPAAFASGVAPLVPLLEGRLPRLAGSHANNCTEAPTQVHSHHCIGPVPSGPVRHRANDDARVPGRLLRLHRVMQHRTTRPNDSLEAGHDDAERHVVALRGAEQRAEGSLPLSSRSRSGHVGQRDAVSVGDPLANRLDGLGDAVGGGTDVHGRRLQRLVPQIVGPSWRAVLPGCRRGSHRGSLGVS